MQRWHRDYRQLRRELEQAGGKPSGHVARTKILRFLRFNLVSDFHFDDDLRPVVQTSRDIGDIRSDARLRAGFTQSPNFAGQVSGLRTLEETEPRVQSFEIDHEWRKRDRAMLEYQMFRRKVQSGLRAADTFGPGRVREVPRPDLPLLR
jgi:hypothetical protein